MLELAAAYLVVGLMVVALDLLYQVALWRHVAPFPGWRRLMALNLVAWPVYLTVVVVRLTRQIDRELEDRKRSH